MVRLVERLHGAVRRHPFDGVGVAVFVDQRELAVAALKLQIDTRQRAAVFIRLGDDDAVNHRFVDLHVHMAGDDRRQLRVGVGDVGHAGAGALIFVVDAHMRHQHDSVDLAVDLPDDLFHRLHRIGEV